MSQNSRNPRDLRQMVTDASLIEAARMDEPHLQTSTTWQTSGEKNSIVDHNCDTRVFGTEDMKKNLDKLKALSEDDKSENGKLRSRIDEQCRLIMFLKQRADEGTLRIRALEKVNKELLEFRDKADGMLKTELSKYNLLDGRFNSLASNHEEMIRIKDEYKRVNEEYREENARLREENSRLFSSKIVEKDNLITELDEKCKSLKEKCSLLEQKFRKSQTEFESQENSLRQKISELLTNNSQQEKDLLRQLKDMEKRLKETENTFQVELESRESRERETTGKLLQMSREKQNLVLLLMQKGKLMQKEQDENKILRKKIKEMENAVRNMEEKFIREAEAVNANLKVKQLTEKLEGTENKYSQLVKEFEAFKKHSNDLLKRERELSEKLRQLYA